jgi:hypothetical protein
MAHHSVRQFTMSIWVIVYPDQLIFCEHSLNATREVKMPRLEECPMDLS